jgi:hypothetical protein
MKGAGEHVRQQTVACLDGAKTISLQSDREPMKDVARQWLEFAAEAEAEANKAE